MSFETRIESWTRIAAALVVAEMRTASLALRPQRGQVCTHPPMLSLLTLAFLVSGCGGTCIGFHPPPPPPPPPPLELSPEPEVLILGRGAFQRGARYLRERRWVAALEAFRVSQVHVDHPVASYNIAWALFELGRYDEALHELEHFMEVYNVAPEEGLLARAQVIHAGASKRVATLSVTVSPRGAVVSVDGIDRGSVGITREFTIVAGRHLIAVRAPGHQTVRWGMRLAREGRYVRELTLAPSTQAPGRAP